MPSLLLTRTINPYIAFAIVLLVGVVVTFLITYAWRMSTFRLVQVQNDIPVELTAF